MNSDCIFCKIVAGRLPCAPVADMPEVMAFLDVHPIAEGHTLVIPKRHFERIDDLPDDLLAPIAAALRDVARRLRAALEADGVSVSQANGRCAGQEVPHLHFHLIPRFENRSRSWQAGEYADAQTMQACAERLRAVWPQR